MKISNNGKQFNPFGSNQSQTKYENDAKASAQILQGRVEAIKMYEKLNSNKLRPVRYPQSSPKIPTEIRQYATFGNVVENKEDEALYNELLESNPSVASMYELAQCTHKRSVKLTFE